MKLMRRNVTAAMRAANRSNSGHSTGPRSERGKRIACLNAAKHWGRAEGMRDLMPALGESPAEFEAMREGLYASLHPQDQFEAMLVDDMADIRWRLRRVIRAEAADQAKRRRMELKRRDERDAAGENGGSLHSLEYTFVSKVGFANLSDSPPKFYRVIEILKAFALMVQNDAIDGEGLAFLQGVYGPHPSIAAQGLTTRFESYLEARKSDDDAERAASRQRVLEDLEAEIAWFEKRAAVDRQARAELAAPRVEAEMLPNHVNLERVMLYQERLERRFDKKWKLLMHYRRMREAERREAELFGDDAPVMEAVPANHSEELQASERTPERNAKVNERSRQPVENTGEVWAEAAESRQPVETAIVSRRGRQRIDPSRDRGLIRAPGDVPAVPQEGPGTGPEDKKGGSS